MSIAITLLPEFEVNVGAARAAFISDKTMGVDS